MLVALVMLLTPLAALPVFGSNPNDPDGDEDDDSDGYDADRDGEISAEEMYTNLEEYNNNTNPNDPDTDGGGAWDGWEIYYGFNPRNVTDDGADPDSDELSNYWEFAWDTDPFTADSDQDGMPDGWEHYYSVKNDQCGLDPSDFSDQHADPDNDGSDNLREYNENTDPCDEDSDDDGDPDGEDPPPIEPGEPPGTRPDTGRTDGNVTIYEIFDPALMTLKRWSAQDALYYDSSSTDPYTMYIYDTSKVEIFPTGSTDYTHIFEGWLWMGVIVSAEVYTPIPSVSPDADIIDYDANQTGLEIYFYKDGADNYYIRGSEGASIDLRYRMGTNGSYFNRPVDDTLTTADLPPEAIRPITGQSEVEEKVKQFLQLENGTEPANPPLYWLWPENGTMETNLEKLVTNLTWYFSNFREGDGDVPDPEPPYDIYQSICINGIGACRHRSFGFFVTANVLGLPTRYVSNEAHAFVEVYVPVNNQTYSDSHWKRINLGGTGSSTTLDRPDDDEGGDEFDFDEFDPDDIENMTGEQVTVVLEGVSPAAADKGDEFRLWGYVEDRNGTRIPDFLVGGGMWDDGHDESSFEIGTGVTNATGVFDFNASGFLAALPGWNEIYAAAYMAGFRGYDGPEDIEVSTATVLTVDAPASVGKGQELIVTGSLLDIGDVAAPEEMLDIWLWEGNNEPWWTNCQNSGWRYRCDIGDVTTDEFGNFAFTWTVPENGEPASANNYHVEVTFGGSTYRYATQETVNLRILESSVDLEAWLDPDNVTVSHDFFVNGTIMQGAVGEGSISVELDGKVIASAAVSDTDWSFEVVAPLDLPAGDYTVLVIFYPDDPDNSTLPEERVSLTLTLLGTSSVSLDALPDAIRNGPVMLEGRLVDHLGEPLADEAVALSWDGGLVGSATTEADGDFELEIQLPITHALGLTAWEASFDGSALHSGSTASTETTVLQQTVLELAVSGRHFYPGDSVQVDGSLAMDNGTPLAGSLNLLLDGVFVRVEVADGVFSFSYVPDTSYLAVGAHIFELDYGRDGTNAAASNSTTLWLHRTVLLELEGQEIRRGESITLEGDARDSGSLPVAGIEISFDWPDAPNQPPSATTGASGDYESDFTVPNAQLLGEVEVRALFDNATAPYYDSAETAAQFTVVSDMLITLEQQQLVRGEQVWFNGTLYDDRGEPVEDLALNLFWNEDYLTNFEGDANGSFAIACDPAWPCGDAEHPVGEVAVRLSFDGFGWYMPAELEQSWPLWGRAITTLETFSPVVVAGSNVTYSGTVRSDLDEPLDRTLAVLWNGITRTTVEAVNGEFSGSFALSTDAPVGNFTLTLATSDQNWLRGTSDSGTVTVQRYTTIELVWEQGFRNATTAVTGWLRDSSGAGLPGEELAWSFDEAPAGTTLSVEFGALPFSFNVPEATTLGPHTFSASFAGSYFYLPSTGAVTGDIVAATSFALEPLEVQRVLEFTLEATLLDDLGAPLGGEMVTLTLRGNPHELMTAGDGTVSIDLTLPASQSLGPLTATWNFGGRDYYLSGSTPHSLTVISPTQLTLSAGDAVLVGESFHVSGGLTDDLGAALQGDIEFYLGGLPVATLATGSDGSYSYDFAVPTDLLAGQNTLTVQFAGSGWFLPSSASQQVQVYHTTHLTVAPAEGVLNLTTFIEGSIVDRAGRPVPGLILRAALPDGTEGAAISDAEGNFAIPLALPFSLGVGDYNVTVTFAGSQDYYGNSTVASLRAKAGTLTELDVPASLESGQQFSGLIILTLEDGTPLANAPLLVSLEPSGMTLLAVTDANGTARFSAEFDGNATQPFFVRVTYQGDEFHLSNSAEAAITWRAPPEVPNYLLWLLVALGVAAAGGTAYGWHWYATRHIRAIRKVLTTTAEALEANADYREAIISSYREMSRVLQGHGYLRRNFETVREFRDALREAVPLDHASIERLTSLYEAADYSTTDQHGDDRTAAIGSLRAVLESLETLMQDAS
ncbi:MAG: hypothetical protein BEU05_00875 [Marine Group III euryarchaeote CG-Bathy2]|uniref:Protein-glutamine gamma-glutamyltransferase-like C-terminal domain-containing protein n=1 Tax=Marine Group III euryarchaeote CG-Bathy2 TaxID=1889002 RepID=A0A1J5SRZ1_9ARCH|nr:MAG: hypothetical protein BEU05_00875 [Marine Group III euryarchaeote CG-Bathy2]